MLKRKRRIIECNACHSTRYYKKGSKCPFCGSGDYNILNQPIKDFLSKKQRENRINRLIENIIKQRRQKMGHIKADEKVDDLDANYSQFEYLVERVSILEETVQMMQEIFRQHNLALKKEILPETDFLNEPFERLKLKFKKEASADSSQG